MKPNFVDDWQISSFVWAKTTNVFHLNFENDKRVLNKCFLNNVSVIIYKI